MNSFTAASIAVAILYVVDSHYNYGRYTQVLQQAVTSLLPGSGRRHERGAEPRALCVTANSAVSSSQEMPDRELIVNPMRWCFIALALV
jgi:hypothetical protein